MRTLIRQLLTLTFIITPALAYAQADIYDEVSLISTENKKKVKLVQDEVDEFTKQVKKSTKAYYSGKAIKLQVFRYGEEYGLGVAPIIWNLGCCGAKGNYIMILFNDDTALTLTEDVAKLDCSSNVVKYSVYVIDESMFQGKTIKKIRLKQSDSFIDADYTCEYSMQELIDALK